MGKRLKRVLVANRGEIAVRVIRACQEMGIQSVALYSDADMNALHIVLADAAYHLPGNTPAETYLRIDRIVEIARQAGCDGVHPGYGFLAENADFARAVEEAGMSFVGPPAEVISLLGNKVVAKELAREAGVPTVPGIEGETDAGKARRRAEKEVGLPLMIKAAAGGGGRGMRIVRSWEEFERSFEAAAREAEAAFGSGELFIEKLIEEPKHIEVQILADRHGNAVHLGERECSVQRRHQKLIEEAPSSVLGPRKRKEIGEAAVALARRAGYVNAGTVEFLYDRKGNFYFMEVNTRLQVEHPVTELVTGIDLVKEQLRIAAGEKLSFGQKEVKIRGHAFEARINAEDPLRGFLPVTGRLNRFIPPAGPGVRLDTHAYEGYTIPRYYDSLVAKLITYGRDRQEAAAVMRRALEEFIITGVRTTIPFHLYVFGHPVFLEGWFDTSFVERYFSAEKLEELKRSPSEEETRHKVAVCVALEMFLTQRKLISQPDQTGEGEEKEEVPSIWQLSSRLPYTDFRP